MPYFVHIDAAGLCTVTVSDAVIPLRGILVHLVQLTDALSMIFCVGINPLSLILASLLGLMTSTLTSGNTRIVGIRVLLITQITAVIITICDCRAEAGGYH